MSKAAKPVAPQKVEYNDAVAESKKYFEGDDLAATVWVSKYALKDSFGNIYETSPKQMHERIAAEIERIERKYPDPMMQGGGVRAARPFPVRDSAGRPDDGYRQQLSGGLALELLRDRP